MHTPPIYATINRRISLNVILIRYFSAQFNTTMKQVHLFKITFSKKIIINIILTDIKFHYV